MISKKGDINTRKYLIFWLRFLQYGSKTAWHYMEKNDVDITSINKFKQLEQSLAAFRKLLRFGRFIDTLYAALKTVNHSDKSIRFCVTFSKVAHSLYLLCDHYLWLGKQNFIQVNTIKWTQTSNKYWLLSIVLNLVRDVIELNKLLNSMLKKKILNTLNRKVTPKDVFSSGAVQFVSDHKDLLIDTVKNGCDILLPLTNLGLIRLSPGTIGVAGMLSSVLSLYTICDQRAKLPYS
ncbi:peroxisomal membrane protein 11B isoform X2 [Daktulosphaira vitifoliae]|uniref:peroxisomal membrane protein 11B isoform X2 n=2 Tax=Daktulosphaira vitifoliae TaxID=58002 RepID=UPI0021AA8517|nr:peroxisomal membrane protein 11B isoform X2 [Daktulosphaira vitifoliae]